MNSDEMRKLREYERFLQEPIEEMDGFYRRSREDYPAVSIPSTEMPERARYFRECLEELYRQFPVLKERHAGQQL